MGRRQSPTLPAAVVNLSEARLARRLESYHERLDRALKANRRVFSRLYAAGKLFTRQGTRLGRDLLTAHEHLLRVVSILNLMNHQGDVPAPRKKVDADAMFAELEVLLERNAALSQESITHLDALINQ